jgi:hypothetical protein
VVVTDPFGGHYSSAVGNASLMIKLKSMASNNTIFARKHQIEISSIDFSKIEEFIDEAHKDGNSCLMSDFYDLIAEMVDKETKTGVILGVLETLQELNLLEDFHIGSNTDLCSDDILIFIGWKDT